jgi:deoxyuridine 5'-triphosphate nucleotidohydrolase
MINTIQISMEFTKISPAATFPTRGTPHSAGFDLYLLRDIDVTPGSVAKARTGISVLLPEGYYGRVAPRSGLSTRGLCVAAGVIDRDYIGEIMVLLYTVAEPIELKAGTRIAQLVVEKYYDGYVHMNAVPGEFDRPHPGDTSSHAGFGSTGK